MGKLTDPEIRAAKAEGRFDKWLADGGERGAGRLVLRIKPAGSKTFYYRYTTPEGRRAHYPIGPYDPHGDGKASFTLAQARNRRNELIAVHNTSGGDVHAYIDAKTRQEARERREQAEAEAKAAQLAKAQSFRALLEHYTDHLKREGKHSKDEVRRALKLHVFGAPESKELCDKQAAKVTRDDIKAVLDRLISEGKKRQADKLRSYFHAAFSLGIEAGGQFCIEQNPAAAIKRIKGAIRPSNRTLSEDELRAFWLALEGKPAMFRDALRLAIVLGGQRFAQLVRVRPQDVDLAAKTVLLLDPKGHRDKPREHRLPLTAMAAQMFESALAINGKAAYVLSSTGKKPVHESTLSALVHEVALQMVENGEARGMFRGGDLRRTCETMLAQMGISKDIRAQIQSHGLGGVQAVHYDRHDYAAEKRAALEAWEQRIKAIVEQKPQPSNVVPLRATS